MARLKALDTGNMLLVGVLLMLAGDFMFALNDAMGKWLVASFSVGQVVAIRSIGAFLILGPMIARQGRAKLFDVERPWLQFWRAAATTIDTACFYAAVVYLPLADVMSFYMAGPIYVAALSHLLLGEKVGWRRWAAGSRRAPWWRASRCWSRWTCGAWTRPSSRSSIRRR